MSGAAQQMAVARSFMLCASYERNARIAVRHWSTASWISQPTTRPARRQLFRFPKKDAEERLLAEYHTQDTSRHAGAARRTKVQASSDIRCSWN
jgi:hypothetical protein